MEIFYGAKKNNDNIIKTIDIDTVKHSRRVQNIFKNKIPNFVLDKDNYDALSKLFVYFTGNVEKCKEYGISLNKAIYLVGGVGTGKTNIMETFQKYTSYILRQNSFRIYYPEELINETNIQGVKYLDFFGSCHNGRTANPITCYIDDICRQNENVNNFGTKINVIEMIMSIRYRMYTRYRVLTHTSSNVYPENLKDYYDKWLVDRFREMYNVIEIYGGSRRK